MFNSGSQHTEQIIKRGSLYAEYQKEINNIISRSRNYSKEMYLHFEKKKQKFFNEMENFNQGDLQWNI